MASWSARRIFWCRRPRGRLGKSFAVEDITLDTRNRNELISLLSAARDLAGVTQSKLMVPQTETFLSPTRRIGDGDKAHDATAIRRISLSDFAMPGGVRSIYLSLYNLSIRNIWFKVIWSMRNEGHCQTRWRYGSRQHLAIWSAALLTGYWSGNARRERFQAWLACKCAATNRSF